MFLSLNLTFDGVFFTPSFDGDEGLILSTLFLLLQTIKREFVGIFFAWFNIANFPDFQGCLRNWFSLDHTYR